MPLSQPITGSDGSALFEIFVPKGTRLLTSLVHCNSDPDIWGPDAEEWNPERWINPLPDTVASAKVPGVYSNMLVLSSENLGDTGN